MTTSPSSAKQIRRADIQAEDHSSQGSTRSSFSDTDNASQLQARLAAIYGDIQEQPCPKAVDPIASDEFHDSKVEPPSEPGEESSYAFKLFASGCGGAKKSTSIEKESNVQRVVISSPSPAPNGDNTGGFFSSRNLGYYMTLHSSYWNEARVVQFADPSVAVSGSWITAQSKLPNRGLELPWRSRTIKVSRKKIDLLNGMRPSTSICVVRPDSHQRKSRPNKKRRIMLRERQRKEEANRAQKKRMQEDKERAEREKRTRRNREKKVKKKEKLKAKKAQLEPIADSVQSM